MATISANTQARSTLSATAVATVLITVEPAYPLKFVNETTLAVS